MQKVSGTQLECTRACINVACVFNFLPLDKACANAGLVIPTNGRAICNQAIRRCAVGKSLPRLIVHQSVEDAGSSLDIEP